MKLTTTMRNGVQKAFFAAAIIFLFAAAINRCSGGAATDNTGYSNDSGTVETAYTDQWIGYGRSIGGDHSPAHWCHLDFGTSRTGAEGQKDSATGNVFLKTQQGAVSSTPNISTSGSTATIAFSDPTNGNSYTLTAEL